MVIGRVTARVNSTAHATDRETNATYFMTHYVPRHDIRQIVLLTSVSSRRVRARPTWSVAEDVAMAIGRDHADQPPRKGIALLIVLML